MVRNRDKKKYLLLNLCIPIAPDKNEKKKEKIIRIWTKKDCRFFFFVFVIVLSIYGSRYMEVRQRPTYVDFDKN